MCGNLSGNPSLGGDGFNVITDGRNSGILVETVNNEIDHIRTFITWCRMPSINGYHCYHPIFDF